MKTFLNVFAWFLGLVFCALLMYSGWCFGWVAGYERCESLYREREKIENVTKNEIKNEIKYDQIKEEFVRVKNISQLRIDRYYLISIRDLACDENRNLYVKSDAYIDEETTKEKFLHFKMTNWGYCLISKNKDGPTKDDKKHTITFHKDWTYKIDLLTKETLQGTRNTWYIRIDKICYEAEEKD